MKMSDSLKTCKDKVEALLAAHPELQDSDKKLWLAYLNKYHGLRESMNISAYNALKTILLNDDTPTMESVRRVRQKLQESGKYVGNNRKTRMGESTLVKQVIKKL